jgi:hypothetical protein
MGHGRWDTVPRRRSIPDFRHTALIWPGARLTFPVCDVLKWPRCHGIILSHDRRYRLASLCAVLGGLAEYVSLFAVFIGVVGESIHEFTGWVTRYSWWKTNGGKLSALIMVVSLGAELITTVKANNISGQIIAFLNDRAANIGKEAEELRASNLALWKQIQPRLLDVDQGHELVAIARRHPSEQIAITSYALDVEAAIFGEQLVRLFRAENVSLTDRRLSVSAFGNLALGIRVAGTDAQFAAEIRNAFRSFGFAGIGDRPPPPLTGITIGSPDFSEPVNIFIGAKPPVQ